jgi:hypothetical protein
MQAVPAHRALNSVVSPAEIGIITPYRAQVGCIRHVHTRLAHQTDRFTTAEAGMLTQGTPMPSQVTLLRELRPRPQLDRL